MMSILPHHNIKHFSILPYWHADSFDDILWYMSLKPLALLQYKSVNGIVMHKPDKPQTTLQELSVKTTFQ